MVDPSIEYGIQDFFGEMDELRIWKTARSGEEILFAMDRYGKFLKGGKDLIAHWTFDEGSGNVVHDITGNGNHLFLTGMYVKSLSLVSLS